MSLHDALAGLRDLPQWFLWRLEWDGAEGKYRKTPCALDGSVYRIDASKPAHWHSYEAVRSTADLLNRLDRCATRELQYACGFWLTEGCGYWFLDIDKCIDADGVLSPFATQMVAAFPGALMEWSSSRKGVHVIGRAHSVPEHRSRDVHKMHLEFYTADRGIAFGLDGEAQGSADTWHSEAIAKLVEVYFPPLAKGDGARRAEWRGPEDDDELIRRALAAKSSAAVAFGGALSFAQLWKGEGIADDQRSNADMSLASHLAFWTGCDEERMERLMRRSGLVRAKWNEHRTYLRELTIRNACALCKDVYQEPERSVVAQQQMYGVVPDGAKPTVTLAIDPAVAERVRELLAKVSACGTVEEMHNEVIPTIQSAGVPRVYSEQLVRAVNSRLDLWDAKLPVGQLRAILFPPPVAGMLGAESPLWLQQHCYITDEDKFYDVNNGTRLTSYGFQAKYARLMPLKDNGSRENPVEWAFTRWNIRTVHRLEYRPDQGPYFERDGIEFANMYTPSSVPPVATEYTERGLQGIEAFQRLLWDMCARREPVYRAVLQWIAHNVQRPGVKVRWSPIIKGCHGDGKSLLTEVIRSAMGHRNVGVTGNNTLRAAFGDWAVGSAVNVIEEIMLTGKERYSNFNAMNEFITNNWANINAKGDKTYVVWNVTNHLALTNYNDALPLPKTDRRWMVIFTPWMTLADMRSYCGLDDEGWAARTGAVDWAWKHCAGELRAWLLSVPLDGFDAAGSAPWTAEKSRMMASGQDDAEAVAAAIIEEGANGVTANVLSSACLSNILKVRAAIEGFEVPRSTALNHMLIRMGYSKLEKQIKWRNATHTFWVKNGFPEDVEGLRKELDRNLQPNLQPS